ncbi:hypothetical protein BKA70DRAFT_283012 [Coprinopsis sp. MPI-PUGE-AT-0042]|nr:hypothetical protein BKA70DRAFT_283012 [Coprinopsis sp. MPI-PUGE-AT-0042]
MFRPLHTLSLSSLFLVVFLTLLQTRSTLGAFTTSVSSGNDTVEQNSRDTWCYYPSLTNSTQVLDTIDCKGPRGKADLRRVMETHLSQKPDDSLSIAYYSAGLERLGGVELPVGAARRGKVYLCLSGQADDGRYKTSCEVTEDDNAFGPWDANGDERANVTVCAVEVGQRNVSDGCYFPVGYLDEEGAGVSWRIDSGRALQAAALFSSMFLSTWLPYHL